MKENDFLEFNALVDTCAWIDFFRSTKKTELSEVENLILHDSVYTCGVVLYELLKGVKTKTEQSAVAKAVASLKYIEMTKYLWLKSSEISMHLRKGGQTIPLSDAIMAAIAIENDLTIITVDKHFDKIPNIKVRKY